MRVLFVFLILALQINTAYSSGSCAGRFPNPITDVCWSCLLPLSIGSAKVAKGTNADTKNPKNVICSCGNRVGISIGFWEPISLVDVTAKPFCMVNLGGIQLGMASKYPSGFQNSKQGDSNKSFYHVHWYKYPLMLWLNIITSAACIQSGEFDVAYMSELDPTWDSDVLSFILNPEAALFGNVIAQSACAADAVSSSAKMGGPLDKLFWCAGSQGSMYPMYGYVQEHVSGVQASTLLSERMAYKLHRQGMLWDSAGKDHELCLEKPHLIIPKSRYRYQMTYPIASSSKRLGCKSFGSTTALWESGKEYPIKGEDFGYLIWRKRNCCAF